MSFNDPLSDLIARIKNAAERKRSKVSTPARSPASTLDPTDSPNACRGPDVG